MRVRVLGAALTAGVTGLVLLLAGAQPASAAVSLGGWMAHSPDDISGFTTLTGNDNVASVTLPFTFTVEGTGYTTLALSTNGWLEFGSNTSGNSDPTNDCLPSSAHTNPLFAAYWDDLNPFGTSVRYGTVGSSPNRVFIADYEVDLAVGEGADDLRFQIQLHESSNTITVRYRDTQNNANGQGATIGYQGAGGAAATSVQPLVCNGKILDDNRPDEGWSADVGRAGQVTLAAMVAHSPDDISGFASFTGDNVTQNFTLPFSVTIEGTAYTTVTMSSDGWLEFGGNTAGNSDPTNDCLPSSAHTNPLLAAYWDDLNPWGGNVRYGVVGSSPNRVFIADYQVDLSSGSEGSDDLYFQVQVHETSGLINVRYRDKQSGANGQQATIGFQGAGGAGARAYGLTCNGKILDDNDETKEGWSVHPKARAMSLHGVLAFSPDDISVGNIPGLLTFSGDDVVQNVTLPFAMTFDGVSYTTAALSTNGWIEFGGNTSGNSDPTNDCLPSSAHTNPLLAAFWDDMQTAGASSIEYGTVGTSPNRTFIVDYFLDTKVSGNDGTDDVEVQVQMHEGSNAIIVKYRNAQGLADGQTATLGFQSAGGAAATATGVTCNGKVLDDNINDSGWSLSPLPICGNGVSESLGGEQCDQGGANGSATSCCSATCSFKTAGTGCRAAAGVCDVGESCTGSSGTCPADGFASAATVCRGSAGLCDVVENCTGSAAACPADGFASASTVCRGSAGVCDVIETCTGSGSACPADGFASPSTVCRPDAGACDVAENCTGSGASCPADVFEDGGTSCGDPSNTVCDDPDTCDGSGTCLSNPEPAATTCRPDAGECDVPETCDGAGNCPADAFEPATTPCGDGSDTACTNPDSCDGAGACAANHAANTVECRAAAGVCDVAETCDGAGDCPADAVQPNNTTCRAAVDDCDMAEMCDGVAVTCPADAFQPPTTACGDALDDDCTNPDSCDGSGACLVNDEAPGFACGDPSDTDCSNPDVCDGAGVCETADETAGTACPDDGEVCTTDACDGAGLCDHPAGNLGVECRAASVGEACDAAESCDGSNPTCPADGVLPLGTLCRADAGDCDVQEECDGVASDCPADGFESSGTPCGDPSDSTCDHADTCDGAGSCASNFAPSTTVCRAASVGEACDAVETCDGAGACPADGVLIAGTPCRADAGVCDVAESCDGTSSACPADGFESDGTSCSDALFCNGIDSCQAGVCVSPGTPCGVGETCNETTDQCFLGGCPAAPESCESAAKSILLIKNNATDSKDKLVWKWIKGAAAVQADFADPTAGADYAFCLYQGGALVTEISIPPSPTLWSALSDKGFKYKDAAGSADGVQKVLVKGTGVAGKSKALLKGKGANLPYAALPLPLGTPPVIAQLRNNANGFCMQGTYATPIKNTAQQYKAKQ